MGIVKISDQLHDQIRVSSAALGRSINAQAEHWLRVGQLAEHHPQLNYEGICALLLQEAKAHGVTTSFDLIAPNEQTLDLLRPLLPSEDYFMPSLEEASDLSGRTGRSRCRPPKR